MWVAASSMFCLIMWQCTVAAEVQHARHTQRSKRHLSADSCADNLPRLQLLHAHTSNRSKCSTDITVVTQLDMQQLPDLQQLCIGWKGWVAAAVFSPFKLDAVELSSLADWHARLQQVDACSLDLEVYTADTGQGSNGPEGTANALMNRAVAAAATEVDSLVSSSLNMPEHSQQLLDIASAKACIVIPAWRLAQTHPGPEQPTHLKLQLAMGTKQDMVKAYAKGQIMPAGQDADLAQHALHLQHWLETEALYGINYIQGFMPHVIVSKRHTPWFDERIKSGALGRALHMEHMHAKGLGFVVHPMAYILEPAANSPNQAVSLSHEKPEDAVASGIRQSIANDDYQPMTQLAPCGQPYQSPAAVGAVLRHSCSVKPHHEPRPALSSLWGLDGEAYNDAGPLRDWHRAGYDAGASPIPTPAATSDLITDWRAAGDGIKDDTQVLKQAIEQTPAGAVIYIPPGRYRLTEMINITKPVILRGAGPAKTVLFFPLSLTEVYGNIPDSSSGYSQWAFRPAYINFLGQDPIGPGTLVARVIESAAKGAKSLVLDRHSAFKLQPGLWIRLVQSEPDALTSAKDASTVAQRSNSLVEHLYGGWDLMSADVPDHLQARELQGTQYAAQLLARIVRYEGSVLTLDRALPFDVRVEWCPEVHVIQSSLREASIEDLHIEFAAKEYAGHFKEAGYNALYFSAAHNCWARNVHISNADYGIGMNGTHFCTLQGIRMFDSVQRGNGDGHHGIDISFGSDNLVTQFELFKEFLHDISVEWYTHGNVFSSGIGRDLNLDHHRGAPFGNLFTHLQLGKGTRPFASSGAHGRGPHAGAFNTYWNLLSDRCYSRPSVDFGHKMTFVGTGSDIDCDVHDTVQPNKFAYPQDLHAALLAQHKGVIQTGIDSSAQV